jgi:hypothetical protein
MNDAQKQALAAGIRASADSTVVAALAIGNRAAITVWCNQSAPGPIKAWNESMAAQDSDEATNWVAFDTLSAGKRDSWNQAFMRFPRDFSRAKVRKWVTDVWGNATGGSDAEAILQAALVNMTNAQVIIGLGTDATTGTVTAKKRDFSALVTEDEVSNALNRF